MPALAVTPPPAAVEQSQPRRCRRAERETEPAPPGSEPHVVTGGEVPDYVQASIHRWLEEERERYADVDRVVLEVSR